MIFEKRVLAIQNHADNLYSGRQPRHSENCFSNPKMQKTCELSKVTTDMQLSDFKKYAQ